MLNNNPLYSSNIYDQNFYQQMMLQKEEQLRKIKSISDLNLSKEQITEYVIAPIRVEKNDVNELKKICDEEDQRLTKEFIESNWWSQRTNAPYKNILKDQDWRKTFKIEDDLIVHKYSDLDKVGLMDEYMAILKLIEKHNGELKVVFSASNESEYKKAFKFVQKYRGRLKYNPKDYNELKNYYDKEQKKFGREQKRLDNIISRIVDEDMDDKELKQIEAEFYKPSTTFKFSKSGAGSKSKHKKDKERQIDRQIQELIDEFGEEVLKELDADTDSDDVDADEKKAVKHKPEHKPEHKSEPKSEHKPEHKPRSERKSKTDNDRKKKTDSTEDTKIKDINNKETKGRIKIKRTKEENNVPTNTVSYPSQTDAEFRTSRRIHIRRTNDNTASIPVSEKVVDDTKKDSTDAAPNVRRIKIVRKAQN